MDKTRNKGGRPKRETQVMSCRVPKQFKLDFEAEAQKQGVTNGDLVVDTYNTLQECFGEISNLQVVVSRLEIDLAWHEKNELELQKKIFSAIEEAESSTPS